MPESCRYCGSSLPDRDAYVRHLATAHEPDELSTVDRRLAEAYEVDPALSAERERVRSLLDGPAAIGSIRLPVGRSALARLCVLALASTAVAAGALAF
ncbi:MAG: hypothetical protein ABEJ80_03570 [Halarchaeum sp.]